MKIADPLVINDVIITMGSWNLINTTDLID